ncbi:hypothetical protein WJX74_003682 [Apatococcus lobatus]|uniref:Uncharacterized protein n=1 Tax=Apatococcus lobatus TaxID=904363 RepID=A0AAW1SAC7_9CHLO
MLPGASRAQEDEGRVLGEELPGGLKLMQQRLQLDHLDLQLIVPHDVDAVMDMYINAGREDLDPYWARPWPSAAALAEKLIALPHLVKGRRVCDLGAGLGIAGIAAALAGAKEVVLLDREPLALRCGLLSAAASGISGTAAPPILNTAAGGSCAASPPPSPLPAPGWPSTRRTQQMTHSPQSLSPTASSNPEDNMDSTLAATLPHQAPYFQPQQESYEQNTREEVVCSNGPQVSAEIFDWSKPPALQPFEVILACDVLYEDFSVEPLAALIPQLLSEQPHARVLLADPVNRTPLNRQRFLELLALHRGGSAGKSGLNVEETSQVDFVFKHSSQDCLRNPVLLTTLRHTMGGDTVGVKTG